MNVLTAQQIKAWDHFTMQHEPIGSLDLMERAAWKCTEWLLQIKTDRPFFIFCGKGNNGGDGLAIGRMLYQRGIKPSVYIVDNGRSGTDDFLANEKRLLDAGVFIQWIQRAEELPGIGPDAMVIDALFGIGIKGTPEGIDAAVIRHMNASRSPIIAIDLPSGLMPDGSSSGNEMVRAAHTLTFQCYKLALLLADHAPFFGKVHVLDIGLHPGFLVFTQQEYQLTDAMLAGRIFRPRTEFAHKGTHGHALIMGGSYGKMGAVVLATAACLRSGAGLVTAYVPQSGYNILQTSVPEAMTITDNDEKWITQPPSELPRCNAMGLGPGMGMEQATQKVVSFIIRRFKKPLVIDADGLNCISQQPELLSQLCKNTILTPHPKEFDRLFGESADDTQRLTKAKHQAQLLQVIIILKGHHTIVSVPGGPCYFNTTGNAGMAKGGSGDVLTGLITALLAQGYRASDAALLGVYLHGVAGDIAAAKYSREAMTATDLVDSLSGAFLSIKQQQP